MLNRRTYTPAIAKSNSTILMTTLLREDSNDVIRTIAFQTTGGYFLLRFGDVNSRHLTTIKYK